LFNRYVDDAASRHHCAVRLNDLVQLIQLTLAKTHYHGGFTRVSQIQNPCRQLRLSLELPPAARHAQQRGRGIDECLHRCVDAHPATSREYKTSDPQGSHPSSWRARWWGRRDSHGSWGNHFEPSTSAISSCLRVSSLLKFVIPFGPQTRMGLSSGALGGILPCRHPWLETATLNGLLCLRPHIGTRQGGPSQVTQPTSYMDFGWPTAYRPSTSNISLAEMVHEVS